MLVLVERFGAMVILVLVWIVKAWHDIAISTGNTNNFKVEDTILALWVVPVEL